MGTLSSKVKITKSKVDAFPFVKPGERATVYRDLEIPGFCVRVGEKTKTFYVNRRVNGKPAWIKLGTYGAITPEQARRLAIQTLGQMESGINPNEENKTEVIKEKTLREALEEYLKTNIQLKSQSAVEYRNILNRYTGNLRKYPYMNWLDKPLTAITRMGFREAYAKLGAQTPSGAEHLRATLHAICGFIVEQYDGGIIAGNPVNVRKEFRYRLKPRVRRIAEENLPIFFYAINKLPENNGEIVRDFLLFTLLNGLRRNEAAKLTWADVDFTRNTFLIEDPKNHKPHCLPITRATREILERRHQSKMNDFVFPNHRGAGYLKDPRKQMVKVIATMNLEMHPNKPLPELTHGYFAEFDLPEIYFTIHDLRRTFAGIARREVGGDWTSRLLNHISEQAGAMVTKRHYIGEEIAEDLRLPLEKVAERIMSFGQPVKPIRPQKKMQFMTGMSFVMGLN